MSKPATVIQIALYPNGRVQCGLEGNPDKAFIARGMAEAMQALLNRIDIQRREPAIEVPAESTQKELLKAR